MPVFLHVGCGGKRKPQTTRGFNTPEWDEVRLDIDPSVAPSFGVLGIGGGIVAGAHRRMEHRVRGVGARNTPAFCTKGGNRRLDQFDLFAAERPAFTGMRIQAGNR